ncbi:uncharacterized protein [Solanum tuberosum]|uniref:uncharacterized protein n=1 Tax=Solanum tuberosum TaxID=4113 RepID=UPI00073A2E0D|nr:PREDICTED: uncharacterized protein LOC102578243 [Solanum tuberosum]
MCLKYFTLDILHKQRSFVFHVDECQSSYYGKDYLRRGSCLSVHIETNILCVKYVGPSGIFAQIKGPTSDRMKFLSSGSLTFSKIQAYSGNFGTFDATEEETVDRDIIKCFQREVCDRST